MSTWNEQDTIISMSDRLELCDLTNPPLLIATWWGAGLFPFAPGTAGSLAALPLIWLAADWALWLQFSMIAILFVVGVWASQKIAQVRGGHDQGFIVIDEVIGQWLTLLLPLGMAADTLPVDNLCAGLCLLSLSTSLSHLQLDGWTAT